MSPVKPIWITIISKPTARWELVPCSSGTLIFLKSLEPSLFSHFVPPPPRHLLSWQARLLVCWLHSLHSPTLISQLSHTSVCSAEAAHRLPWDSLDNSHGTDDHGPVTSSCQPTAQLVSPKRNEICFRVEKHHSRNVCVIVKRRLRRQREGCRGKDKKG